jgi:hypothetical protein
MFPPTPSSLKRIYNTNFCPVYPFQMMEFYPTLSCPTPIPALIRRDHVCHYSQVNGFSCAAI